MGIRLSRDDLDKLLGLVESSQIGDRAPAASATLSPAAALDTDESAAGSCLGQFGRYFDAGLDAAGPAASTAEALSQSQTYGSHSAITDVLRRWTLDDGGRPVKSAYLLSGDDDGTGRSQLPTLDHVRENFRVMSGGRELTADDLTDFGATGLPLLRDAIPAFSSDGSLDLDSIGHLLVSGDGRANGPASAIHSIWHRNHNQWVDRLRSESGDSWSEDDYFEAARLINVAEYQRVVFTEFADAVSGGNMSGRAGFDGFDPHGASASAQDDGRFSETVSFLDATGEERQISLASTFLGSRGQDITIDGVSDVARQSRAGGDLASLSLLGRPVGTAATDSRDRDAGTASFNQLRAELFVLTGLASLRPYESWADFQARNNLSDDLVADLAAAYPEGIGAMDVWVGALAEAPADGQLGSTLGWIARDELDQRLAGNTLALDLLDGLAVQEQIETQSFADIVRRTTGLSDLPDNVLLAEVPALRLGDDENVILGTDGDDVILGGDGDDVIFGGAGDDVIIGGRGNDQLFGDGASPESSETGEDAVPGLSVNDGTPQAPVTTSGALDDGDADHEEPKLPPSPDLRALEDAKPKRSEPLPLPVGEPVAAEAAPEEEVPQEAPAESDDASTSELVAPDMAIEAAAIETDEPAHSEDADAGTSETETTSAATPIVAPAVAPAEPALAEPETPVTATDGGQPASDAAPVAPPAESPAVTGGGDVLDGGEGDDEVYGGGGNDVLIGGAGNDLLAGGSGDDDLYGGTGEDLLAGGSGNDSLAGNEGDDALYGGSGDDDLSGGAGEDVLAGGSGADALSGGADNDVLSGGSGSDSLDGGEGSDTLLGGEGDDSLYGDDDEDSDQQPDPGLTVAGTSASDTIVGGTGSDTLDGGRGQDVIAGGAGTDAIDGGDHSDTLDGGAGDDWLSGGRGNDELKGGTGNDIVLGGSGNDDLSGGEGDDRLEGGSGSNRYDGGAGDDWIISISGSDTIVLQPGFGNDYVSGFDADSSGSGSQLRIDVSAYGFDPDTAFGSDILIQAAGDDVQIQIRGDTLTLLNVNAHAIDQKDFIF